MLLKGCANNMCVVGGDASIIISRNIAPQSIDQLFINHPEPPERNSGVTKTSSENSHLLNVSFLRHLKAIMKTNGILTIVTDNLPYAKSLCGICHEAGFKSGTLYDEEDIDAGFSVDVLASVGLVQLMEGMPGPESGYTKGTESYFDRLWQRGQRSRRFYLSVVKLECTLPSLEQEDTQTETTTTKTKKEQKLKERLAYKFSKSNTKETEVETPWHRDQSY